MRELIGAVPGGKAPEADAQAEQPGLTEERRALVYRYMNAAEPAEPPESHAAVNLLPATSEAPPAAARTETTEVREPSTWAPDPVVAKTRDWEAGRIGRGTRIALLLFPTGLSHLPPPERP